MSETKEEIKFVLPPQLRQMFFNSYLLQMEEGKKLAHPTRKSETWGKPLSVFFLMEKEKNIQRYKFEKHISDSPFTDELRDNMLTPFGIDMNTIFLTHKLIIAECKFSTMEIYLQKIKMDGTKEPIQII
jgi:hypothetical protein